MLSVIIFSKWCNNRFKNWDFVTAKTIIRKKLEELEPEKYSLEETGKTKYNTQSLGAKLYKLLKDNNEQEKL